MLEFCVLSSGSRANCLYIGSPGARILVDCGLSCRETVRRLASIGVDAATIDAIIVTHEHSDHVSGVPSFAKKHGTRVYANCDTFAASDKLALVDDERRRLFRTGELFDVGPISLHPFSIVHDAADPVGLRVEYNNLAIGVVTDLGQLTPLVRERTRGLHALVIESNHCPQLLQDAPYPWYLKQRISGRNGHLSNETACELLEELCLSNDEQLQFVIAAHISENSNNYELAIDKLKSTWSRASALRADGLKTVIAEAERAAEAVANALQVMPSPSQVLRRAGIAVSEMGTLNEMGNLTQLGLNFICEPETAQPLRRDFSANNLPRVEPVFVAARASRPTELFRVKFPVGV